MKDTNSEKSRHQWIDLFRGVAVLWMIETHTANTFLQAEILNAQWFKWINYANGLVASAFLFIAGVLSGLIAGRKRSEVGGQRADKAERRESQPGALPSLLTSALRPLTSRLARIGQLLLIGYALHFPIPFQGGWMQAFSHIDILQCMAVAMLVGVFMQRIGIGAVAAAAGFFIFAAPPMSLIAPDSMPVMIAGYVNRQNGALFPLFPWAGFFLMGWLCNGLKPRACLIATGACWSAVLIQHFTNPIYPRHDYYLAGPGFFFERLGWLLLGSALCQLIAAPGRSGSGEHTRLACWLQRLAATKFAVSIPLLGPRGAGDPSQSSLRRGLLSQHARRVCSPEKFARPSIPDIGGPDSVHGYAPGQYQSASRRDAATSTPEACAPQTLPPRGRVIAMIRKAGACSLAIYIIHLQMINLFWGGAAMLGLPQRVGPIAAAALFLAIAAISLTLTALLALPRVAPACRWLGVHRASA